MKNLILTLTFAMLFSAAFAQQTITQSFAPAGNDAIEMGIKNNGYTATQGKIAKFLVQVEIKVNYPKEVIDQLVLANRYKVTSTISATKEFKLTAANLEKAVTIGGKALTEEIKISVSVPPLYTISGTKIIKAATMKAIAEPLDVVINFVYPAATNTTTTTTASGGKTTATPTLQEIKGKYGDIIMGGMAIDFNQ